MMSIEGTCDALPKLSLEQAWRIKYTWPVFTCQPELDRLGIPQKYFYLNKFLPHV